MTDSEQYSETYTKRRTITAGEPTESEIRSVGRDESGNKSMVVLSAGEYYKVDIQSAIESDYVVSKLIELKDDSAIKRTIDVYYNEDMTKCGFSEDNYQFDIRHLGESVEDEFNSDKKNVINEILIESAYQDNSPLEDDGWRVEASEVNGKDAESFQLVARADNLGVLEWDLDVPLTTEEESSETAKLIENQGGGSPDLIEDGGKVNIIHKSDLPRNLDYISYDNQGEWALIEPTTFDEWEESNEEDKTSSKQSYSSTSSNNSSRNYSRNRSRSRDKSSAKSRAKELRIRGFTYGLLMPLIMNISWSFLTQSMVTEELASSEFYTMANNMFEFIMVLSVVLGVLMIMYSMILQSTTGRGS